MGMCGGNTTPNRGEEGEEEEEEKEGGEEEVCIVGSSVITVSYSGKAADPRKFSRNQGAKMRLWRGPGSKRAGPGRLFLPFPGRVGSIRFFHASYR